MAATLHKLGPGQLVFGETGSPTEWGAQVSECTLTPDTDTGDTITVLSGEEITEETTTTWTLEGKLYQSYDADSLIKWCFDHANTDMKFTFRPRSDKPLQASGTVKIQPIAMGGKVKDSNESDFEFTATAVQITTAGG